MYLINTDNKYYERNLNSPLSYHEEIVNELCRSSWRLLLFACPKSNQKRQRAAITAAARTALI